MGRGTSHRADALLRRVPARAWQCISAGKGARGQRNYDWMFLRLDHDVPAPAEQAGQHWLEVGHLFAALLARPAANHDHRLRLSLWRRRHQARARTCHYCRQAVWDP
jgi:hypothetical protein